MSVNYLNIRPNTFQKANLNNSQKNTSREVSVSQAGNRANLKHLSTKNFLVQFGSYKVIDKDNWDRKQIYECFSGCQNPFWQTTARCDVSNLLTAARKRGIPTSHAILYMIGKTVNNIPEFKQQIKDGEIIEYDKVGLGPVIPKENNLFNFGPIQYNENPQEFFKIAKKEITEIKKRDNLFPDNLPENLVYTSCLPWIDFTSFNNPIYDYKKDSNPRIVWGKYTEKDGKTVAPFSVEVNHSLVDGYHVGRFFNEFEQNCKNAEKIFTGIDPKTS